MTNAKRIFYFYELLPGFDSGSSAQILRDYVTGGLPRLGWQITLPFKVFPNRFDGWPEFACRNEYSRSLAIKSLFFADKFFARLYLLFHFVAWARNFPGGICICVIREDKFLYLAMVLRVLCRFKLISELHEGGMPFASRSNTTWQYQTFLNSIDGIVFTSRAQLEYIVKLGFVPPRNAIVLPNSVETGKFSKATRSLSKDVLVLTYAGSFIPWKNVPLLFASLALLPSNYRLRIAGGKRNSSHADEYIRGLSSKYDVGNRVDYLGFVEPERVIDEVIDGSSVLLCPLDRSVSSMYATSPMKLVEYMATPIPIVAADVPSVRSLASEDEVFLASPDPTEFASAIVLASQSDCSVMIARANQRARTYDSKCRADVYSRWLVSL
ncbi:glycosyltransferase family 4 protein [Cyanobium sp. WAJ14-Wanaka]|uniref:glycosyltransferase family 4 protein n=1 Tax=Cyanobium sp. WAJ14-Wanaka TaxID=2823725 RepID=UPI0020CE2580|nr:glycosyltransferase family 4 protein [Cyanobium sp. WAJ14-Wanaka]MCP9775450.1 glycosyltransferase family 4 protein [Cyanobium sp. WAJ14-Wanaka]